MISYIANNQQFLWSFFHVSNEWISRLTHVAVQIITEAKGGATRDAITIKNFEEKNRVPFEIFKLFFPIKDQKSLMNASLVCKSWARDTLNVLLESRTKELAYFFSCVDRSRQPNPLELTGLIALEQSYKEQVLSAGGCFIPESCGKLQEDPHISPEIKALISLEMIVRILSFDEDYVTFDVGLKNRFLNIFVSEIFKLLNSGFLNENELMKVTSYCEFAKGQKYSFSFFSWKEIFDCLNITLFREGLKTVLSLLMSEQFINISYIKTVVKMIHNHFCHTTKTENSVFKLEDFKEIQARLGEGKDAQEEIDIRTIDSLIDALIEGLFNQGRIFRTLLKMPLH